jgi:hypothetical protein
MHQRTIFRRAQLGIGCASDQAGKDKTPRFSRGWWGDGRGRIGILSGDEIAKRATPIRTELAVPAQQSLSRPRPMQVPPAEKAEQADQILRRVAESVETLPNEKVNNLLKMLIGKMEADLASRNVEVEIRLPSWLAEKPTELQPCLENSSAREQDAHAVDAAGRPAGLSKILLRTVSRSWLVGC